MVVAVTRPRPLTCDPPLDQPRDSPRHPYSEALLPLPGPLIVIT